MDSTASEFRPITSRPLEQAEPRIRALPGDASPQSRPDVMLDQSTLLEHGIFGLDRLDPRSRTFVLLRSQLMNRLADSGGRSIAVTSTRPGEGKSFIAANLAAAISRMHPTILLDLDLRKPTVATRFGLPVAAGIDDYLDGTAELDEARYDAAGTHLTIVPVRTSRLNSADLLASDRMGTLIGRLRGRGSDSFCIVDTPPILALDDILLIIRHVDGILMVVEEGGTRRDEMEEALRLFGSTPLVGAVLNKSFGGGARKHDLDNYYYYRSA